MMFRNRLVASYGFSLVACLLLSAAHGFAQDATLAAAPPRLSLTEVVEKLTEKNLELEEKNRKIADVSVTTHTHA